MSRNYHQPHHSQHQRSKPPIVVHDHDVLSGRGVNIAHHPGNERFRSLVTTRADESYCTSYSASEKRAVAEEIIRHITSLEPPGRFLKRDGRGQVSRGLSGPWEELSEREAVKKTCQALRDCNRTDRTGYASAVVPPEDVVESAEKRKSTGLTGKQYAAAAAAASTSALKRSHEEISPAPPSAELGMPSAVGPHHPQPMPFHPTDAPFHPHPISGPLTADGRISPGSDSGPPWMKRHRREDPASAAAQAAADAQDVVSALGPGPDTLGPPAPLHPIPSAPADHAGLALVTPQSSASSTSSAHYPPSYHDAVAAAAAAAGSHPPPPPPPGMPFAPPPPMGMMQHGGNYLHQPPPPPPPPPPHHHHPSHHLPPPPMHMHSHAQAEAVQAHAHAQAQAAAAAHAQARAAAAAEQAAAAAAAAGWGHHHHPHHHRPHHPPMGGSHHHQPGPPPPPPPPPMPPPASHPPIHITPESIPGGGDDLPGHIASPSAFEGVHSSLPPAPSAPPGALPHPNVYSSMDSLGSPDDVTPSSLQISDL